MAIQFSISLFIIAVSTTTALKHKGITVANEQASTVSPVSPTAFNLRDMLGGGFNSRGLGVWTNILRKVTSGARVHDAVDFQSLSKDLRDAMEASHTSSNADHDPHLHDELASPTVHASLQNPTEAPEHLVKAVQEHPHVKQLEGKSPAATNFIQSPGAVEKILSPNQVWAESYIEKILGPERAPEHLIKAVKENPQTKQLEGKNPAVAKLTQSPGAAEKTLSPERDWAESAIDKILGPERAPYSAVEKIQQTQPGHHSEATAGSSVTLPEGLKLRQIRRGDGKTFPTDGDDVSVQYKGYLKDGTMFDNGLFSFRVGTSEAIQGWELGVKHMSLGEHAVLQVPASLGYGSDGAGPIPPSTDLVFDMTLQKIN